MMNILRKGFYKLIGLNPYIDRFFRYRNPKNYWRERGGERYFEEQEAVLDRTQRSEFIAGHIAELDFRSLLEIGCGYGKQLGNIRKLKKVFLAGIDFSLPQILKAREWCPDVAPFLVEADAEIIPFKNKIFDAALSSAVILHNKYEKARKIIAEMIRVTRRYLVHNEDTDITFSRYGYDMMKTYKKMNFKIIRCDEIPCSQDRTKTQFTIVELPSENWMVEPGSIPLQYH